MGVSQISGYGFLHISAKSVNFAKIFVSISLYKRIFIVMRQVIKKNVEALVEMIDKMRSSIVKPVLKPQDEDTKNEYLRIMTAVIEEKLYADVQMDRDTFASRMKLSRHSLNKIISSNTNGLSFPQWINRIRIDRACDLLKNSPNKSVVKIAGEVGLTPDNLRRLFRQYFGISPSEYRNT